MGMGQRARNLRRLQSCQNFIGKLLTILGTLRENYAGDERYRKIYDYIDGIGVGATNLDACLDELRGLL